MAQNKTQFSEANVQDFLNTLDNPQKIKDCLQLIDIMESVTSEKAKMFGTSIIGCGKYHYKYSSGHSGEAPLLGFSPRKAAISLYIHPFDDDHEKLFTQLGKFKIAKACVYVKKLTDIDLEILKMIMLKSVDSLCKNYTRMQ